MPFIPHTGQDVRDMLDAIGVKSIEQLFDEIPADIPRPELAALPPALSEMEVSRLMRSRARDVTPLLSFVGAGAYEHHIPAAVWQIVARGEIYSAYTPYQAEASQGTLQILYEYQTMMASLTGMDASNASLYDGASALAEAVLMAVRAAKRSRRVLMPSTVNPVYRSVVRNIVQHQQIEIIELDYDSVLGATAPAALATHQDSECAALVVPQPNYFGGVEDVDRLTDWAHAKGTLVIGLVNPTAMALLKPPGAWGTHGADIAVGEGQPLGVPLASGGPYFGFLTCKQALVRQMPARIVGGTVDIDGRPGFTLTLQAREQHIRRSKATSNICTNQGLAVSAATIYMAIMGPGGLRNVALHCHQNLRQLRTHLTNAGIRPRFTAPCFHESAFDLGASPNKVVDAVLASGIHVGVDLAPDYPELNGTLLMCTTETKSKQDIERVAQALTDALRPNT
ncbi:MAG: aminomethyl-transferring glycine dehydrogenase subunit GcvPA [Betaproteobacteria bacterium]|nr:aminomethyl-transferring glycine dehydrogenase subunit GcvPA [Betaproteobacteria bacterium]